MTCPPPVPQRKWPLDLWRGRAFSPVALLHISASNRHPMNSHLYLRLFICSLKIHLIYLFLAIYILSAKTNFFKLHVYHVINSWHLGFFSLKKTHIFIKTSTEVVSYHKRIVLRPLDGGIDIKKIDKFTHF